MKHENVENNENEISKNKKSRNPPGDDLTIKNNNNNNKTFMSEVKKSKKLLDSDVSITNNTFQKSSNADLSTVWTDKDLKLEEDEIFNQIKESYSRIEYKDIKLKKLDYGGPFTIFRKNCRSKYGKTTTKHILSAFRAWKEESEGKKKMCLDLYYQQLLNEENSYDFKPKYLKQPTKIRNIVVMPYFLWLSWYLKNMATEEMLKKDNFELAIELGTKWNGMLNELKRGWSELVHRDIRKSFNKKGGESKVLNKLFH